MQDLEQDYSSGALHPGQLANALLSAEHNPVLVRISCLA